MVADARLSTAPPLGRAPIAQLDNRGVLGEGALRIANEVQAVDCVGPYWR